MEMVHLEEAVSVQVVGCWRSGSFRRLKRFRDRRIAVNYAPVAKRKGMGCGSMMIVLSGRRCCRRIRSVIGNVYDGAHPWMDAALELVRANGKI